MDGVLFFAELLNRCVEQRVVLCEGLEEVFYVFLPGLGFGVFDGGFGDDGVCFCGCCFQPLQAECWVGGGGGDVG